MEQKFTSKGTSINSSKSPVIYSLKKAVESMTGKRVIDIGGGKFDTAIETQLFSKSRCDKTCCTEIFSDTHYCI